MYYLLISRNVFFDSDDNIRKEIFELAELVKEKDIQIVLVTRSQQKYKEIIEADLPGASIKYGQRGNCPENLLTTLKTSC